MDALQLPLFLLLLPPDLDLVFGRSQGDRGMSSPASSVGSDTMVSASPPLPLPVLMDRIGALLLYWDAASYSGSRCCTGWGRRNGGGGGPPAAPPMLLPPPPPALLPLDLSVIAENSDNPSLVLMPSPASDMVGGGFDPLSSSPSSVSIALPPALLDMVDALGARLGAPLPRELYLDPPAEPNLLERNPPLCEECLAEPPPPPCSSRSVSTALSAPWLRDMVDTEGMVRLDAVLCLECLETWPPTPAAAAPLSPDRPLSLERDLLERVEAPLLFLEELVLLAVLD